MKLFRNESNNAKWNAQRNLQGLTHYVDDDTLRFHKSRIISTHITDSGLLFALVESCAKDFENRSRGFRYVIFDTFGNVIERPELDEMWSTSTAAVKAMWQQLNTIDAVKITSDAIDKAEAHHAMEIKECRRQLADLTKERAA